MEDYNNDSIFLKIITKKSKTVTRNYQLKVAQITGERQEYEVSEIIGSEEERFKHQYLLPSTFKTEEKYYDYNYYK